MKLEVGKKYVCRDRADVKYVEVVKVDLPSDANYTALGVFFYKRPDIVDGTLWDTEIMGGGGESIPGEETDDDLVAEYVEPKKMRKVTVWDWYSPHGIIYTSEELNGYRDYKRIPGTEREIEVPE